MSACPEGRRDERWKRRKGVGCLHGGEVARATRNGRHAFLVTEPLSKRIVVDLKLGELDGEERVEQ